VDCTQRGLGKPRRDCFHCFFRQRISSRCPLKCRIPGKRYGSCWRPLFGLASCPSAAKRRLAGPGDAFDNLFRSRMRWLFWICSLRWRCRQERPHMSRMRKVGRELPGAGLFVYFLSSIVVSLVVTMGYFRQSAGACIPTMSSSISLHPRVSWP